MDGLARIRTPNLGEQLGTLGEFIASQRRAAELSLRQLAEQTGVSNPYLSQIERGLRRPSAEVLQQLSKALRVSAETLYVKAGILDPEDHPSTTVETAVLSDVAITERQKRVLIDVYRVLREGEREGRYGVGAGPRARRVHEQDIEEVETRRMIMATTTTRRPTPAQARKAAVESDYTALYAAAGLTDLVAESIKNIVVTTQERATRAVHRAADQAHRAGEADDRAAQDPPRAAQGPAGDHEGPPRGPGEAAQGAAGRSRHHLCRSRRSRQEGRRRLPDRGPQDHGRCEG